VIATANVGNLISVPSVFGEDLGDRNAGCFSGDGLKRATDFRRRIGFHVPCIDLARRTEVEDHDRRTLVVLLIDGALRFELRKIGQREAGGSEGSRLDEVATIDAVAGVCGPLSGKVEHRYSPPFQPRGFDQIAQSRLTAIVLADGCRHKKRGLNERSIPRDAARRLCVLRPTRRRLVDFAQRPGRSADQ